MSQKIKWADLFDFSDDGDLKKAIAALKVLDKEYEDFIKTTKAGTSQIESNQKALVKSIQGTTDAAKKLNETNKEDAALIQKQNAELKALSATYEAQKKQIAALEAQTKKLTKERAVVSKKTKDVNNINKEAIKLEAQLGKLTGATAKETAALKLQIQEKRKALKDEAKVAAGRVTLYQKESKRLNDLRNKYKNVALAQGENSKSAKRLLSQITPLDNKLKQLDRTVGQGQRSVGLYSQAFSGLSKVAGALGVTGVVVGLVSAFKNAFKTIRDFDKEIRNLAALSGVSREELKGVEDEIRRVGRTSINTALDVAKTATALTTLGKSRKEVIDLLEPVNNLSIALQAPADAAGELLIQTLNAFGKSSKSAQEYADVIAKIRSSTALDFERIKDSLAFVAPTAKALGLTFQETGALLGVLVDNGIKASRAGRLLSSSFARLNKEGLTLEDALEQINNSQNKAKTATELFGTESFTLGLILADNTDKVKEYTEQFNNAGGALDKLTNEQLKSLDSKLALLNSAWDDFTLSIENGEGAIGAFIKASIEGITDLLNLVNQTDEDIATKFITKRGIKTIEEFNSLMGELEEPLEDQAKRASELARQYIIAQEGLRLYNIAQEQGISTAEEFAKVQDEFFNSTTDVKDKIDITNDVLALYNDNLEDTADDTKEVTKETSDLNKEFRLLGLTGIKSVNNVKNAVNSLKNFINKTSEEVFGATETVEDAMNRNVAAVDAAIKKIAAKNKKANEDKLQEERDQKGKEQIIRETGFEVASIAGNQVFENRRMKREQEFADLQAQKDAELALAEGNAQKQAAIEARFAKKEKSLKIKQAKDDRKQALFNIALNTAQAIIGALATLPSPSAVPLSISAGLIGAAQAAAVLSAPLPAFEHGGMVETDGKIQTSEKGREMYVDKHGKLGMTRNSGTEVRSGMKGSFIIPNHVTESLLSNGFNHKEINEDSSYKIQKALQNEKDRHTNRLIVETRKENDLLMKSFNGAMDKIEVHKHHFRRGELVHDMKRGNTTIKDWESTNSY